MRVCLICNEYPPAAHGGNGSLYFDLAEGLVAAGHKVTVVGVYPEYSRHGQPRDATTDSGVRVVRLPPSPAWMRHRLRMWWERRRQFAWLKREHKRSPFDVIEAPDYEGWLCNGGPRDVATIVRMGGSNLFFDTELGRRGDVLEHTFEARCVARATHLAAVSHYCARRTLEIVRTPERPCAVIHNAVDTRLFRPAESGTVEQGLVVFVNSVAPKKGIEELVQAMNIVCEADIRARLVVIGQDTQKKTDAGTYVEHLESQVRPEFSERIVFTGRMPRDEIIPWLQRAAVCCYPSQIETFGIAPLEAMAVGRPTIFSKTGPGPEIVEDWVSGLLCDPHDAKDIAQKILRVLGDAALAEKLGRNARKRIIDLFDKENWIAKNLEFYKECLINRT